jgi:hypothetical protein
LPLRLSGKFILLSDEDTKTERFRAFVASSHIFRDFVPLWQILLIHQTASSYVRVIETT